MDQGEELATAGLVVAFAAVLLVASHLFIEFKSAKQLVNLKMPISTIASSPLLLYHFPSLSPFSKAPPGSSVP